MSMKVTELEKKTKETHGENVDYFKCVLEGAIKGIEAKLTLKSMDIQYLNEVVQQHIGEDVEVDVRSYNTTLDSFSRPASEINAALDDARKLSESMQATIDAQKKLDEELIRGDVPEDMDEFEQQLKEYP